MPKGDLPRRSRPIHADSRRSEDHAQKQRKPRVGGAFDEAGDEARTRDLRLGKPHTQGVCVRERASAEAVRPANCDNVAHSDAQREPRRVASGLRRVAVHAADLDRLETERGELEQRRKWQAVRTARARADAEAATECADLLESGAVLPVHSRRNIDRIVTARKLRGEIRPLSESSRRIADEAQTAASVQNSPRSYTPAQTRAALIDVLIEGPTTSRRAARAIGRDDSRGLVSDALCNLVRLGRAVRVPIPAELRENSAERVAYVLADGWQFVDGHAIAPDLAARAGL